MKQHHKSVGQQPDGTASKSKGNKRDRHGMQQLWTHDTGIMDAHIMATAKESCEFH